MWDFYLGDFLAQGLKYEYESSLLFIGLLGLKGSWVWHLLLAVFFPFDFSPISSCICSKHFKTSQATDESDPTLPFQLLTHWPQTFGTYLIAQTLGHIWLLLVFSPLNQAGVQTGKLQRARLWTQKDLGLNSGSARCYLCDLGQVTWVTLSLSFTI